MICYKSQYLTDFRQEALFCGTITADSCDGFEHPDDLKGTAVKGD